MSHAPPVIRRVDFLRKVGGGIFLPPTCMKIHVNIQENYVDIKHNYVDIQHN